LIIFKTREELVEKLFKKIKEIHPYEAPEIIEIKVEKVNDEYLKWLKSL
jgi:periplasmic divalent cation tolerance protein